MGGGRFSIELHIPVSTRPTMKKRGVGARYNCRTLSLRGNWDDGVKKTCLPSPHVSGEGRFRGERNTTLKLRLAAVAIISMALAGAVFAATSSRTNAQAGLPQFRVITYLGIVTIGGQPAQDGLLITARVGNYESEPVKVGGEPGQGVSSGTYSLNVGPAPDFEGLEIEFWIEGQVKADQTGELFGPIEPGKDTVCLGCPWSLPILRRLDLTFSTGPVATPTQTFTPTATAVILEPAFLSGTAFSGSSTPPDGTLIYAKIDEYQSEVVPILNGRFTLVLNPVAEEFGGKPVNFFLSSFQSLQPYRFTAG